jgi:hypothetical protein
VQKVQEERCEKAGLVSQAKRPIAATQIKPQ